VKKTKRSKALIPQIKEPEITYPAARLTAVSLFSGAGGMDIGVEAAGFRNLCCVEWDPNAAETLRQKAERHATGTRVLHADIRTVSPESIAPTGIDLLHGGPPCQAFSLIGKRGSLEDERGLLLFEMVRFAKTLRPRAILLEQVKGLLSAPDKKGERGGALRSFLKELNDLGCGLWCSTGARARFHRSYAGPERVLLPAARLC
jgi:DNA (cytosine-5)-methyltransferase 1